MVQILVLTCTMPESGRVLVIRPHPQDWLNVNSNEHESYEELR